jgi:hypothetical protein
LEEAQSFVRSDRSNATRHQLSTPDSVYSSAIA